MHNEYEYVDSRNCYNLVIRIKTKVERWDNVGTTNNTGIEDKLVFK